MLRFGTSIAFKVLSMRLLGAHLAESSMFSKAFRVGFGAMALGAALFAGPVQAALVLNSATTGTSFLVGDPFTGPFSTNATQSSFSIDTGANVVWDFSKIELFQGSQAPDSSIHQIKIVGGSYNLTLDAILVSTGPITNRKTWLTWDSSNSLLNPSSLSLTVAANTVFTITELTSGDSAFWTYNNADGATQGIARLTGGSRIIDTNGGGGNNGGTIPEPTTLALIGLGLLGAARIRRRTKN
jgi:hypothetical protein